MKRTRQGKEVKNKAPLKRQNATVGKTFTPSPKKSLLFTASNKQGPELKNLDLQNTLTPAAGVGTFTAIIDLNVASQGTTAETRVGRKIVMKSFDLRWSFSMAATSTGGSPVRVLIVYDKQANAALPAITDILATNSFFSPMNLANSERFVVVKSFISEPISLQNNFAIADHCYVKMDLETVFNDVNGGTVGDIQTGSLLMAVAQTGNVGTAGPVFGYYTRVRFEDN